MTHDERHVVSNMVGSEDLHIEVGPSLARGMAELVQLGRQRMVAPEDGAPSKADDLTVVGFRVG